MIRGTRPIQIRSHHLAQIRIHIRFLRLTQNPFPSNQKRFHEQMIQQDCMICELPEELLRLGV